jgi:ATP-binding protein involved in chromosome partitioning
MGMVQNMSLYTCPNCNHQSHLFGKDGAKNKATKLGIEILADVPLHEDVCTMSDQGKPIIISQPQSMHSQIYKSLASNILLKLNL